MVSMQDGIDLGIDGIDDGVEIGAGGFGVVFRALQRSRAARSRCGCSRCGPSTRCGSGTSSESEILRALSVHPNIVALYAAGFTAVDQPFLIMEYMPNGSLADRIERDGRVPWGEAVDDRDEARRRARGRARRRNPASRHPARERPHLVALASRASRISGSPG